MSAEILSRAARASRGLTQVEFSRRSGVAGSSLSLIESGAREPTFATLETILRAARQSVVTIPTVRADAAHIAAEIKSAIVDNDDSLAFQLFIQLADNLAAENGATKVGLTLTQPESTGSRHWNAAIAAVCEYRLNSKRLPVPDWIKAEKGKSFEEWIPRTGDYYIQPDRKNVPREFLKRGILIEQQTLESA
jgi:transcriptional regulator with XRE-family HTH domain